MTLLAKRPDRLVIFQKTKRSITECDHRATIHDKGTTGFKCNCLAPMVAIKPHYVTKSGDGKELIVKRVVIPVKIVISKYSWS
jgi:hypothetical protein